MSSLDQFVVGVFILFCRIGGCLVVAAGFASARVPIRVRLFFALAVTLERNPEVMEVDGPALVRMIFQETLVGFVLGFTSRVFLWALQFMATAISTYIGLGGMPGASVDDGAPVPGFAAFASALALVLVFAADLHWKLLAALVGSYDLVSPGSPLSMAGALDRHAALLSQAFLICAQIAGPFFAFTLTVNLIFGLVNKMVPQIPAYFISIPFMIAGGLLLIHLAIADMFQIFVSAIEAALRNG